MDVKRNYISYPKFSYLCLTLFDFKLENWKFYNVLIFKETLGKQYKINEFTSKCIMLSKIDMCNRYIVFQITSFLENTQIFDNFKQKYL